MSKSAIFKTSLDLLFYSGATHALGRLCSGMGAIFMLHHIRPGGGTERSFAPNSGLEVTPDYLDAVITRAAARGYELLSLGEGVSRLASGTKAERPFACFTIDDGYRDNLVHAWPVFRRRRCPFTIFVAPAIADGVCELWWLGLEAVIAGSHRVTATIDGDSLDLDTLSDARKRAAFARLYWPLRDMEEHAQRAWIRDLCADHGIDLAAICRAEAMTWNELRDIAADPLCEIGAHTINHYAIAKLAPDEALEEMRASRDRIARELGRQPRFFAYPYGDAGSAGPRDFALAREAGFEAALTTRKGMIFPDHRGHLTALPRVSLNGGFQKPRYTDALLSGVPFAIWNGFRRFKAA